MLVDIYATLLNLERVGADDSFFDVGGSSLQAMQLVTRLRNDLAVDVDVPAIFLAPTPEAAGRRAARPSTAWRTPSSARTAWPG